jgi:hypothetical protein
MRFGKSLLMALLAVALSSYAFECEAMTTAAQAMQCCKSMDCSTHHRHGTGHHDMDCCKTVPSMHAPFVQSLPVHLSFSPTLAMMPVSGEPLGLDSCSFCRIAARSHAPPILGISAAPPLRI